MADVSLTPVRLVPGTKSAALVAGGSAITTGQTFEILCGSDDRGLVLVLEDSGGSATPIVFDAGGYPPAMTQGKGLVTITESASATYLLVLEAGRHMQNTGKITGSATGGTVKMKAFYLPVGY